MTTLRIAPRFCGPPDSGNGGYSAGLLGAALGGVVEVTLRKPPPLNTDLTLELGSNGAELRQGELLIAEARPSTLTLEVPEAPSFAAAQACAAHYVGHARHHFPTCFVCGPARAVGDGLRIFPGRAQPSDPVAAPWQPDTSLTAPDGPIRAEVVWAALDCVGYFGVAAPEHPVALLGRITAEVTRRPQPGERCVVLGWGLGREGRKLHAGTAVLGEDGALCGRARQTWIAL